MPNYKNGEIHSVRCYSDDTLIYIGSTTQTLAKRWGDHKLQYSTGNHVPYHKIITDINDWYLQLEEEFPCNNKEQLEGKEFEIMLNLSALNRTLKYHYKFLNSSELPPKISRSKCLIFTSN